MTHLNRILIQKTSASSFHPFSAILPVSSATFVSLYNTKLCGKNIPPEDGEVSNAGIIKAPKGKSSKKSGEKQCARDKANPKFLRDIRFVTGISITSSCLGWAEVDLVGKSLVALEGQILNSEPKEQIQSLSEVYHTVREVKEKIPKSDLYIMESYKYHRIKNFTEKEIQYLSMLIVLLNSECSYIKGESVIGKVILQKSSVIDSMFELKVGDERVSANQKIQRMLSDRKWKKVEDEEEDDYIFDFPFISNIKVGKDFLGLIYDPKVPFVKKNACSQALLLLFSFIDNNGSRIRLRLKPEKNAITPPEEEQRVPHTCQLKK